MFKAAFPDEGQTTKTMVRWSAAFPKQQAAKETGTVLAPFSGLNGAGALASLWTTLVPDGQQVTEGLPSLVSAVHKPYLFGMTGTFVGQQFELDFLGTMRVVVDGVFRVMMAAASDLMKALPQATVSLNGENPKQLLNEMAHVLGSITTVSDAKVLAVSGVKSSYLCKGDAAIVNLKTINDTMVYGVKSSYLCKGDAAIANLKTINDTMVYGVKSSHLCKGDAAIANLKTINDIMRDSKIAIFLDLLSVVS
jgi:hypothetical protein